jgi:serine/threonine protein kinase
MEFMSGGSLDKVILSLDDTKKAIIIVELVVGMEFLSSHGVIHRNVKPENILIDGDCHCRIGGFGRGRLPNLDRSSTQGLEPSHCMAPELYDDDESHMAAVDVFSFALILYEMLTGSPVFRRDLSPHSLLRQCHDSSQRPTFPDWMNPRLKRIIKQGWSADAELRPSFEDIMILLQAMSFKLTEQVDVARVTAAFDQLVP